MSRRHPVVVFMGERAVANPGAGDISGMYSNVLSTVYSIQYTVLTEYTISADSVHDVMHKMPIQCSNYSIAHSKCNST